MKDSASQTENYKNLISELIQKQIIILGPTIAIMKARNVPGLRVADEGVVRAIEGDPKKILQKLVDEYMALSGLIVKKTVELLMNKYPVNHAEK